MADKPNGRGLDNPPPGPPELMTRRGLADVVQSRDAAQGGTMPGMGGPNAIGTKAMAAEQALGELAKVMPDPSPLTDIIARLQAAVVAQLSSSSTPPQPGGGGLAGIVAPPAPMNGPAMGGMGTPAPPMQ